MTHGMTPSKQGLYDPRYEHDSCGVGFVVDLKSRKSHSIVEQALQILLNLEHRGACGCEKDTGDGAGILVQTPHDFLAKAADRAGFRLPAPAPTPPAASSCRPTRPTAAASRRCSSRSCARRGRPSSAGATCRSSRRRSARPRGRGCRRSGKSSLAAAKSPTTPTAWASSASSTSSAAAPRTPCANSDVKQRGMFYVPSLSFKTLIYKGMLNAGQLGPFYPDLADPDLVTALALVHSRFSTNTFPNWARAHPYRYIAHNGEINTLRGNVNWMTARENLFRSELFGPDVKKLLPIIDQAGSDSAMFDNALELLVLSGRSLPHAVMMMIPEPWGGDPFMSAEKKAFYEFHSCMMEPWDGPASIAFTDGVRIGAVLDRNGLRPSRYYVTKDGLVVMASEVGVLDIEPERVLSKGRLQPGRMFLVDLEQGRIIADDELKSKIVSERPYGQWVRDNLVALEDLPPGPRLHEPDHATVLRRQRAFGYTTEDLKILMAPMAADGNEAVGSMGNDAALAVLSDKPQLLYNYFKQLFAQVTNPPVDGIREELIMSMETTIGAEYNLLAPTPRTARQVKVKSPIIDNDELDKIRRLDGKGSGLFKSTTLSILYPVKEGEAGLQRAMDEVCRQRQRRRGRRLRLPHPLRPRRGPRPRPDPGAPGDGRRASPPDPPGRAHQGRPGAGER